MAVPTLLGAEMPDASKWATILSFLGIGVVKSSGENYTNSAAMHNDAVLRLTFGTNSLYRVSAAIIHNSNATADFKFLFAETSAGGVTGRFDVVAIPVAGTALTIAGGTMGTVFTGEGASSDRTMLVQGWLNTGANAGDLVLNWAQNVADASTTSVQAGSWLELRKIS